MTLEHAHRPGRPRSRTLSERADSVPGAEKALGKIWAALSAERAPERRARGGAVTLARTRVLTLVVVASRPETSERAIDAVHKLAARHPSRTVVLALGDPTGPPQVDARVQAHCHLFGDSNEVCTEQIFLRLGGEACQHLGAVATPLLVHDLPVALWWTDDPPLDGRSFAELAGTADRLIVDSGLFRDDGRARLISLAERIRGGLEVHDFGWMRLELWRELLASTFEDPALAPYLQGVGRVRVRIARPGSLVRVCRAALYVGWLAARLGWRVDRPLQHETEAILSGRLRGRRRAIDIEIAAQSVARDPRLRAPGSLLGIELEAAHARHRALISLTRQDDHLLAQATIDGRPHLRRAATLERFEDSPYLAHALEASSGDQLFEAALVAAVPLVGRPPSR